MIRPRQTHCYAGSRRSGESWSPEVPWQLIHQGYLLILVAGFPFSRELPIALCATKLDKIRNLSDSVSSENVNSIDPVERA